MIDFVFALVHYCVYNDYKITKCAHCGKLFITKKGKKNGEEKYCCRNSPFVFAIWVSSLNRFSRLR